MSATPLLAGFECGHIQANDHDLLQATRHTPDDRMGVHYGLVRSLGITRVRDGLPWRDPVWSRIAMAEAARLCAIWDCCHFDPMPDSIVGNHARLIAAGARNGPLWVCPMNEPSIVPILTDASREWAVATALLYVRALGDLHPDVHFVSVDAIDGQGEHQYAATDTLVASGKISIVGVNYYPHLAEQPLSEVILSTWRRYGLPVMVSETNWHDGHEGQARRHPGCRSKGDWFAHVMAEAAAAQAAGAVVDGVCRYPIVDTPAWDRSNAVWSHGLIRQDLSFDSSLLGAIAGCGERRAA